MRGGEAEEECRGVNWTLSICWLCGANLGPAAAITTAQSESVQIKYGCQGFHSINLWSAT